MRPTRAAIGSSSPRRPRRSSSAATAKHAERHSFVDVGVADGLVHRSEITWQKGADPTSLYPLGTPVRVVVMNVDRERQRISLSIKRTGSDPWERYVNELETGQTIAATVTRVMP